MRMKTAAPRESWTLVLLALVLAAASDPVPARPSGAATPEQVLEVLDRKLQSVETMGGDFVQTFVSSGLGVPQAESGTFLLKRPDLMRWVYEDPERKLAVSDGRHTWLFMEEEGVVYKGSVASWKSRGALAVLAGGSLRDQFRAVDLSAERASLPDHVLLVVEPKEPQEEFVRLELEVRSGTMEIASITAVDAMGSRIGFRFAGIRENVPVPAGAFRFEPPEGAKIIEQD